MFTPRIGIRLLLITRISRLRREADQLVGQNR